MDELFEDPTFQKKISRIPPHLRETFMDVMQKLCNRESEILLDFIGQSRNDMTQQAQDIGNEQTKLKTHASNLEEKRKAAEEKAMKEYMKKKGKLDPNGDIINPDVKNTPLMELYFKQKARKKARSRGENVSESDEEFDATANGSRMSTVASTQSIPTPVVVKTIEELRDELFQNLNTADAKMQEERQRQSELLDFLKDVKSKKKTDKAQALLSEASHSEKVIAKSKDEQERKFHEKLEEKKKRKNRNRGSKKRKSVISLANGGGVDSVVANGVDSGTESSDVTSKRVSKKERRRRRMSTQLENACETADMLNDELHIVDETAVGSKKRDGKNRKSKDKAGGK